MSWSGQSVSFSSYVGSFSYSQTLGWCCHKETCFFNQELIPRGLVKPAWRRAELRDGEELGPYGTL